MFYFNDSPGMKDGALEAFAFFRNPLGYIVGMLAPPGVSVAGVSGKIGTDAGLQNKINHVFGKVSHNLGTVVQQYGSQTAAYLALVKATIAHVMAKGLTGQFQEVIKVGGVSVTVRGAVVAGVVKIGTAFK